MGLGGSGVWGASLTVPVGGGVSLFCLAVGTGPRVPWNCAELSRQPLQGSHTRPAREAWLPPLQVFQLTLAFSPQGGFLLLFLCEGWAGCR